MEPIRRVLLATDFSATAKNARVHAVALAQAHNAELHVLHVQILLEDVYGFGGYPGYDEFQREQEKAAESKLAEHTQAMPEGVTQAVRKDVSAASAILGYADENNIDLIVVGTHARDGLARMFLGSVAARVVRDAQASVLAVGRENVIDAEGYAVILAAVDFSSKSLSALKHARHLAHHFNAELIVMHVVDDSLQPPYYADIVDAEAGEQAMQALVELIDATADSVEPRPLVKVGNPHHCITDAARENNAQLIVMGTLGLRGVKRILLGSVTDRVIRDSSCAVLACREPDPSSGQTE